MHFFTNILEIYQDAEILRAVMPGLDGLGALTVIDCWLTLLRSLEEPGVGTRDP